MSELSTRPYLIRAIYEWCTDSALTPYLSVRVNANTQVPMGYVKDGEIVLSLSATAVRGLELGNDYVTFAGRFGGIPSNIVVPIGAVIGIFAKETGQGLLFQPEEITPPEPDSEISTKPVAKRPVLKIVK